MVLWDVFLYFQSSAPFLLHVGKRQKPVGGNRERHEEWRMTAKDGRKSLLNPFRLFFPNSQTWQTNVGIFFYPHNRQEEKFL